MDGPNRAPSSPPGDAGAEEFALAVFLFAADGVGPERVAAIDNDIILVDAGGDQLLNDGINRRPSLDKDDEFPRLFDGCHQILHRFAADQPARRVFPGDEFFHDLRGAVIHRNLEAMIGDIQGKILAHDRQSD